MNNMIVESLKVGSDVVSDLAPDRVVYCKGCERVHLMWEKRKPMPNGTVRMSFPKITRLKE
jgi:hypothetical protein